ncbi:MAG: hypothetical protein U0228_22085 [Myxococcaceae bacterium]
MNRALLLVPFAAALSACSGAKCETATPSVGDVCIPRDGGLAANQPLVLEQQTCASACELSRTDSCSGSVAGGTITLTASSSVCADMTRACPAICALKVLDCTIPPLDAGTYRLVGEGLDASILISDMVTATRCAVSTP